MTQHPTPPLSAPPLTLPRSLVLVGMMGSGKSTLGRRLAAQLHLPFYDSDDEIEAATGCSVSDIFAVEGEAGFREREHQTISRLLTATPVAVIATGGGAFVQPRNHALIQTHGLSLWLNVPVEELYERTARRNTRPLLKQGDPREILTRLLAEREDIYKTAHMQMRINTELPHETLTQAIKLLRDYLEYQS